MAMATQGQVYQYRGNLRSSPEPSSNTNTSGSHGTTTRSSIATNRWGPYSGAGDFASNMALVLAALLASLALGLALNTAVRYLLRRGRRGGAARDDDLEGNRNRSGRVPEKPAPPPPSLALVHYSAAAAGSEFLAGAAAAECAICLAEFADGDAVRVMPACRHGFHARCIELWLARGRRSSCPTCRAPAVAVAAAAAPPADDDESSAAPAPSASS